MSADLILWRHAEAHDGSPDLRRELTARGAKQAQRVAHWLREHLPARFELASSPATRALQTASALREAVTVDPRLAPHASAVDYLIAAGVDDPAAFAASGRVVVLVGHQPIIGQVASRLLAGREMGWSVRKGAVWWLTVRARGAGAQAALRTVVDPDRL